ATAKPETITRLLQNLQPEGSDSLTVMQQHLPEPREPPHRHNPARPAPVLPAPPALACRLPHLGGEPANRMIRGSGFVALKDQCGEEARL
ncbi:hypothetical protein, partial [Bordetella bronchiseptica]|uniref:hypothetical protein n=1 Tax=Bordetella bronchiseptica TaxID=518 RepID=UPI001F4426D3